jgi:ABC-type Fe3+ transport system permease subunit
MSQQVSIAWQWLRALLARRKWIVWVALVILVLIAVQIGVSLLPHHVINTLQEFEEKPNGVREGPNTTNAPRLDTNH